MAEAIKGVTVHIGSDTVGLQAALSDVEKSSRGIQRELMSVEKLLKMDPRNTELVAQRQKLLSEAVAATKSKLDALRQAQEQVNEKFKKGEITEAQYRAFQREIVGTERKLRDLEKAAQSATSRFSQAADMLHKMGDKVKALGDKFKPLSLAAGGVLTGMITLAAKSGQAADDINTLSKQTGLATDTLQKFRLAADITDVPLETMTKSLSKLTRSMGDARDGSKPMQDAFNALGVSVTDNNGNLRKNEQVFYDVIAALGKVGNETERDALSMQIFGKSAQELNPLILGGADALRELGDKAEKSGLIMSKDALDAANKFRDELDLMKATASATFGQLGVSIGQILLPLLQRFSEGAGRVATWMRGLDQNTLKTIMTIALLVAGIAPALIAVGKLVLGVGKAVQTFQRISSAIQNAGGMLKMLTSPVGIAVLAIAGLVTAGILLWKNWDKIKKWWIEMWQNISDATVRSWNYLKEKMYGFLGGVMDAIRPFLKVLPKSWQSVWDEWRKIVEENRLDSEIGSKFQRIRESVAENSEAASEAVGKTSKAMNGLNQSATDAYNTLGKAKWRETFDKNMEILNLDVEIAASKYALLAGKQVESEAQVKALGEQLSAQQEHLGAAARKVDALTSALTRMKAEQGANSLESKQLTKDLLDAQKAYQDIQTAIDETNKKLREQQEGEAKSARDYYLGLYVARQVASGGIIDASITEKLANIQSSSPVVRPTSAMIPVAPAHQNAASSGPSVINNNITEHVNIYGSADKQQVRDAMDEANRKLTRKLQLSAPGVSP